MNQPAKRKMLESWETAIGEDEATVGGNTAPDGNDAAGENGGNGAPSKKGRNASDGLGNRR